VRCGVTWSRTNKWTLIDVEIQTETEFQQQTTLDDTRRNPGCANGTEQYRVKAAQSRQCFVTEYLAVAQVTRTTEIKERRVEFHATGAHHLECLCGDLWADTVTTDYCDAM